MKRLQIFGSTPSPYTQKMLSLLRYRRIPFDIHWGNVNQRLEAMKVEPPKPILLPVILLNDTQNRPVATTDSTPIIRRLEQEFSDRSSIPDDQSLAFINYLLEDFADEWLTKYMFHYRWHFKEDADKAGTILPLVEFEKPLAEEEHKQVKQFITQRQTERLWVVGSSNDTAELIDQSFKRFISMLNKHLIESPFLLGERPSSADFAFYGQLSQLVKFDPTPRKICHDLAPRVVAWVEVIDDLSGLSLDSKQWTSIEASPKTLRNIFEEFGMMYAPLLIENAKAVEDQKTDWKTEVKGAEWRQKTFSYQAKCLNWIREEYALLNEDEKKKVKSFLEGTNCEQIL